MKIFNRSKSTPIHNNGHSGPANPEQKGLTLRISPNIQFFSPDGTRTIHRLFSDSYADLEDVSRDTAFAAAAYLYVAVRYRMKKVSEPPLMVVQENADGNLEWDQQHPLEKILDQPSPDFDMGELLARTQSYIDVTGGALWLKEAARNGLPSRLTPFHHGEFTVEQAGDRIYGLFRLQTTTGEKVVKPEDVVYFHEINPFDWYNPMSMVDAVLSWLNLGQRARAATSDILKHSLFPSVVVQAHQDWNPDQDEYDKWKQDLDSYADRDKRGAPLGIVGGGSATRVGLTLRDLIPGDILDRVESVVAAVAGIPAVVLQYQIGMENAPWSQMAQARRMTYEDTIEPLWREYEKRITRQLLWAPVSTGGTQLETDTTVKVVFDTSDVRALQVDKQLMSQVAVAIQPISSVNERRQLVGLEPVDDERADKIPELEKPAAPPTTPGGFVNPFAAALGEDGNKPEPEDVEENPDNEEVERGRRDPFNIRSIGSRGGIYSISLQKLRKRNGSAP